MTHHHEHAPEVLQRPPSSSAGEAGEDDHDRRRSTTSTNTNDRSNGGSALTSSGSPTSETRKGNGSGNGNGNGSDSVRSATSPHQHVAGVTPDALQAFQDAMDMVEELHKDPYLRAQSECPACVLEHECCPCYFLVACKFDPWAAAKRMCCYWKDRIELFGSDRAFQPLTLGSSMGSAPTGLTQQDVDIFDTGYILLLPSDQKGRSILYCDRSKLGPGMEQQVQSRLRVLWYMFQAAYTSGEPLGHKVVFLIACPGTSYDTHALWKFGMGCRTFPQSLPITMQSIQLLSLTSQSGTGTVMKYLLSTMQVVAGLDMSKFIRVHHGADATTNSARGAPKVGTAMADAEARRRLMIKLRTQGFSKKGIPEFAGGSFTMNDFYVWARRRRRIENRLFWTDDQRNQQRRDVNKIHSRQKRQRRRHEQDELKDQAGQLEIANVLARMEGERLEQLVTNALEVVHQNLHEGMGGPEPHATICDDHVLPNPLWPVEPVHHQGPAEVLDISLPPWTLESLEPDPIGPLAFSVSGIPSVDAFNAAYVPPPPMDEQSLIASLTSESSMWLGPAQGNIPTLPPDEGVGCPAASRRWRIYDFS